MPFSARSITSQNASHVVGFKSTTTEDPHQRHLNLGDVSEGQRARLREISLATHTGLHALRVLLLQTAAAVPVAGSLSLEASKALVHAFVSSRLEYSNPLLSGIADGLLQKLQSIQNAAARHG